MLEIMDEQNWSVYLTTSLSSSVKVLGGRERGRRKGGRREGGKERERDKREVGE